MYIHRYNTIADSSSTQGVAPPKSWTAGDLEGWLLEHATSINEGRVPLMDVSLFQQGFDRQVFANNYLHRHGA